MDLSEEAKQWKPLVKAFIDKHLEKKEGAQLESATIRNRMRADGWGMWPPQHWILEVIFRDEGFDVEPMEGVVNFYVNDYKLKRFRRKPGYGVMSEEHKLALERITE